MSKNNVEIERKFLIKEIPFELNSFKNSFIKQGYISIDPVLRLRQTDNEYVFTFKGKGQIKRTEFEFPLSEKQFCELWNKVEGNEIVKRRYFIPLNDIYTAELDIYEGNLKGFKNVEVEFSCEKEADIFLPPKWFGEDISHNPKYTNANMAFFGL